MKHRSEIHTGRMRCHADGTRDKECSQSGEHYRCKGCRRTCCWCFGADDEMPEYCDDCWAGRQDTPPPPGGRPPPLEPLRTRA